MCKNGIVVLRFENDLLGEKGFYMSGPVDASKLQDTIPGFFTSPDDMSNIDHENYGRPWDVFDDPKEHRIDPSLTHVSLFSGCGGFDVGFHQAGFKTVFANDIDVDACLTYKANVGEIDAQNIKDRTVPRLSIRPDVLTAGFPCQPFSNAGSRNGVNDNRGDLYRTAIDYVRHLRPKSVVFENVRGMLSFRHEGGLFIQEICQQLDELGYDVVFSLIDASRHHVPQRRLRVFVVGTEKNRGGRFAFPKPVDRKDLTLERTILDLTDDVPNQRELMQLNPQALEIGAMIPEGGSWKSIPYDKLPERLKHVRDNIERYHYPNFYRRFARDEVAGTITAAFKPENAGVWHPVEQRIFSVREIARIQSFPDWFQFHGRTVKSKYRQIGNAVPPRLAYEIALNLKATLDGADLRTGNAGMSFERFVMTGKPLRSCDRDIVFSK